jgi:amino acid transporter/nucleotide-binding universal stress UspA family protein
VVVGVTKTLERDLGLYATVTISIGAMIGSGIFVLPGLASKKAGPAVILAYLVAGVVVLPSALSKAEMATAIPEAGGTYLYIDRAMGPLMGTVAGIGAWFSLVFKSAFALIGLSAYLVLFVSVPAGALKLVSLGLGVLLITVNVLGVKQTGRLQAAIVTVVLLVLVAFVADGITYVDQARYHPFFTHGSSGVLAASGFVFVSYAGVTKIASVAEEVENPGRNIPRAILSSVVLMMLVYLLVVFVVIGVVPSGSLHESLTPMTAAAEGFAGDAGRILIASIAVLALTSMANAGLLASSRYPLAMSRDSLAPESLSLVSDRFNTPVQSIGLTGGLLLVLVAFVPVLELAKLASAFKILIFTIINFALVAFREGDVDWYDPEFVAPGYPWVQVFGILGGLVLLTQMGALAIGGAVLIILAGVLWFRYYGQARTEREGAAVDAIRAGAATRAVEALEATAEEGRGDVVVAMDESTTPQQERALLEPAASLAAAQEATLYAVRFEAVPDQLTLSSATDVTESDREFEAQTREMAEEFDVTIEPVEVVAHDVKRALVNYVEDVDAGALIGAWRPETFGADFLDVDTDWVIEHAPCDVVFVRSDRATAVDEVAVLTRTGPRGSFKIQVADAVARANDASIRFVTALGADASDALIESTRAFHEGLGDRCEAPWESDVRRTDDPERTLADAANDADLSVLGIAPRGAVAEFVFGNMAAEISDRIDRPTLLISATDGDESTFLRRVLEWVAH